MNLKSLKKELPFKLFLNYFTSLNTHIKVKEDPISFLPNNFSDIKTILPLKKSTQVFNFNKRKTHFILYVNDEIIEIKDRPKNDLSFDYYLTLLIEDEPNLINYIFQINYVNNFSKLKKAKDGKYFNIIKSIIIIKYINNYKNSELENENIDYDAEPAIKEESENCIKNNIETIKEIFPNSKGDDIYEMSIEEIYTDIIIFIIKNKKLSDYEFCYDIVEQIDLEVIDLQFMESERKFNKISEVLDPKNDFIKSYIIKNFEDIKDENRINFYFILLKYFLKSSIYIYHIPLLFQAHQKIIEFIKIEDFSSITFENQSIKERFEYIIKAYSDLDYYYSIYLNKKADITNLDSTNCSEIKCNWNKRNAEITMKNNLDFKNNKIREEILNESICTFDILMGDEKKPVINNINIIYRENNAVNYEELLKLDEFENFNTK